MAIDFNQIGNILGGIGASVQGRGLEFAQQQNQQRRQGVADARAGELFDLNKRQKGLELEGERQKIMFTDASAANTLIDRGDLAGVANLARNRLESLNKFFPDADPSNTVQILQLAELAQGGDKEALSRLKDTLSGAVDLGQQLGILPKPEGRKFLKTEGGKAIFKEVDGTIVAEDISGLTPSQTREQVAVETREIANNLKRLDNRSDVNTNLRGEGVKLSKSFTDRQAFAGTINNILEGVGSVSDLALGTAFFKIIDPGSTVTQNEFAQIAASRNVGEKAVGVFNKLSNGEVLNDTERKTIARLAQNQLNSFKKIAKNGLGRLINIANQDKRFKEKFTASEIYGDTIENLLLGGDIDPEKLGVGAPSAQPSAGTIVPGSQPGATATITSQAQFDALPSGATFIEDGVEYRKP